MIQTLSNKNKRVKVLKLLKQCVRYQDLVIVQKKVKMADFMLYSDLYQSTIEGGRSIAAYK